MDKLKTWLVEVVVNKVSPQVVTALIAYLVAFMGAHEEMLQKLGITFYGNFTGVWDGPMPTGQVIVVELDTLHVYGGVLLATGIAAIWALLQHHGTAVVTGQPQSGDKRQAPTIPTPGGERKQDQSTDLKG